MKFSVYSSTNAGNIDSRLGGVDYSYYFVLESYLPLLQQFGEVEILLDPDQASVEPDETGLTQQYYLSFTPPNRVHLNSGLPTIPVFAWEFGTLPDEAVVSDADNWKHVLQQTGYAITHSQFAVQVVRNALGANYPVVSIPAPVWDRYAPLREKRDGLQPMQAQLSLDATVIDSRDFEVKGETLCARDPSSHVEGQPLGRRWLGEKASVDLQEAIKLPLCRQYEGDLEFGALGGGILLPAYVCGALTLDIDLQALDPEAVYMVSVQCADGSALLRVPGGLSSHRIEFNLQHSANTLYFAIATAEGSSEGDLVSVKEVSIESNAQEPTELSPKQEDQTKQDLVTEQDAQWYGVHDIEDWGRWTAQECCGLVLPSSINGNVRLAFTIKSSMMEEGEKLVAKLGCQQLEFAISEIPQRITLDFLDVQTTDHLEISGLNPVSQKGEADERRLGLGLSEMSVEQQPLTKPSALSRFTVSGLAKKFRERIKPARDKTVLYTTVFNPIDGRKNWPDIIKAFVFSLRERSNAVLLVKITHTELSPFVADLSSYFVSLAPFKCRIVFVHGYLDKSDYEDLISATSFIVNASRGEGQCLPLMEFMSSGVPAIAPDTTAMADYVTPDNAFVVQSTVEPAVWPQDPRLLFRTTRYRLNWESLYNAFSESYELAVKDASAYARMSKAAIESQRAYSSMEVATDRLSDFLKAIAHREIA